jgi:hypothetical protein
VTRRFVLVHPEARQRAAKECLSAPEGFVVTVSEPKRNLDQNARMWAMLGDIAHQVEWYGKRLTSDDWKNVFTASLRKLQVVPNLDGSGFVALGMSTSRMTKAEMSDLIELMTAFGAERGVLWSESEMATA